MTEGAFEAGLHTAADDYPELPEPHNNLAVIYAQQGRYEEYLKTLVNTHVLWAVIPCAPPNPSARSSPTG